MGGSEPSSATVGSDSAFLRRTFAFLPIGEGEIQTLAKALKWKPLRLRHAISAVAKEAAKEAQAAEDARRKGLARQDLVAS